MLLHDKETQTRTVYHAKFYGGCSLQMLYGIDSIIVSVLFHLAKYIQATANCLAAIQDGVGYIFNFRGCGGGGGGSCCSSSSGGGGGGGGMLDIKKLEGIRRVLKGG